MHAGQLLWGQDGGREPQRTVTDLRIMLGVGTAQHDIRRNSRLREHLPDALPDISVPRAVHIHHRRTVAGVQHLHAQPVLVRQLLQRLKGRLPSLMHHKPQIGRHAGLGRDDIGRVAALRHGKRAGGVQQRPRLPADLGNDPFEQRPE